MGLSGKLIGAGLGYFITGGSPLGAIVGGVIGHYVKDAPPPEARRLFDEDPRVRQQRDEFLFVADMVGILTEMARADGKVKPEELTAVRSFFSDKLGYRGESMEIVQGLIERFLHQPVGLDALCIDMKQRSDYETRLLLIDCLLDVAFADGLLDPAEKAMLGRAAALLGVSASDLAGLMARRRPTAASSRGGNGRDYEVLGISPTADAQEVKSAYRKLAMKYHPDKVAHLGEEFKELAHKKFLEIQKAYDNINSGRGWA